MKDLEEIDQTVRHALHFVPVETVDAVFTEALLEDKKPTETVDHLAVIAAEKPKITKTIRA